MAATPDARSSERLEMCPCSIAILLSLGSIGRPAARLSLRFKHPAPLCWQSQPHLAPGLEVFLRRSHNPKLGAVADLDHIIAAVTEKYVADHDRREDIVPIAGRLRTIDVDFMLADRNRRVTTDRERGPRARHRNTGDRDVIGIERLAFQNIA